MFLHLCVILFTGGVSVPACTIGHMTRGVSVQGDFYPGGSLSSCLCLVGSLSRGSLSRGSLSGGLSRGVPVQGSVSGGSVSGGISVQGGLCPGVSVQWGLCPLGSLSGGSLSWGVSVQQRFLSGRPPDRDPPVR